MVCRPGTNRRRSVGRLTSADALDLTGRWAAFARIEPGAGTTAASFVDIWEDPTTLAYPFTVSFPSDPSVSHGEGDGTGDHLAVPAVVVSDQGVAAWVVCRPHRTLERCGYGSIRCIWAAQYADGADPSGLRELDRGRNVLPTVRLSPDRRHVLWYRKHNDAPNRAALTRLSSDERPVRRCT